MNAGQMLAAIRWGKTTPEQRSAHARYMRQFHKPRAASAKVPAAPPASTAKKRGRPRKSNRLEPLAA